MNPTPTLPALLESYFTQRLIAQRQASPHTIASYQPVSKPPVFRVTRRMSTRVRTDALDAGDCQRSHTMSPKGLQWLL